MTVAEILAQAKSHGVQVGLTPAGDGLRIGSDEDIPADLVELIKGAKPQLLAALRTERGRINQWIAARIVNYPADRCLHCRKRIIVGQAWIDVTNGEAMARFHRDCHVEWLAEQEARARKALGLNQEETHP